MAVDINLKLLRTFEAVARNRSFTKAAGELRRSQATVSSQVGGLEQQLGVPLMKRTSRRVSLTVAGEDLAAVLECAFRLIDDGLEKVRDHSDSRRGRIVVACVPSLSGVVLPAMLAAYRIKDRATRIDVEELTSTEIVTALLADRIDFGIGPCVDPPPEIAFAATLDEPLCVLLSVHQAPAEVGAAAGGMPFATLVSLPLITLSGSVLLQRQLEQTAAARGMVLQSQSEVRHVQTAIGMVHAGVGAAIVPQLALPATLGPGLVALPIIDPAMTRRIGIVTLHGAPLRPAAGRLARYIRAALARQDPDQTAPSPLPPNGDQS